MPILILVKDCDEKLTSFTDIGTAEKFNNSQFVALLKGFKGDGDQKLLIRVFIQCRF